MLDPAIQDFLNERKKLWLKKKIKAKTTDDEKLVLEQQAAKEFSLANWLPGAAKRAKQLSLVSHPSKFSHPSAKTTAIIATAQFSPDGFLKTGNAKAALDVFGNAAALDVYKFLSIQLADKKSILDHLEEESTLIKDQLTIPSVPFADLRQEFLAIKQNDTAETKTSGKVKQVYFPVNKGYHLLSIMTPSSLMYEVKRRIIQMHFSDDAKEVRTAIKANKSHDNDLSKIYGLSVIGYGGTKPQNISVLNSSNHGTSYLLPSIPPDLSPRTVQPPRISFFTNSLWPTTFKDNFQKLHRLLLSDTNNTHIRKQRDWTLRSIVYQVTDKMWMIRSLEGEWSDSDNYQNLPQYQKIWLDQQYRKKRQENSQWFDSVQRELARWLRNTYTKLLGTDAIALGDEQLQHFKDIIAECREAFQ